MRTELEGRLIDATAGLEGRAVDLRAPATKEAGFSSELGRAVEALDRTQTDADREARLAASGAGNLHEVALALEKADVAMRLAMKVRNKVVDAYNEIMRMGV